MASQTRRAWLTSLTAADMPLQRPRSLADGHLRLAAGEKTPPRGWDTHNGPRGVSTPMMTRKPDFLTKLLGAEVERSPTVTDEC